MSEPLVIYLSYYTTLVTIVRPAIVAAILIGLWIAFRRTRLSSDAQLATWFAVAIPLVAWLAIIWSVAASGVLQARPGALPLLALPFALVLPVAIGLVLLTRSERIANAADAASPGWLIGLQVYRVLGGNFVALWALGGAIPGVFAIPAGFGDMLVGVLALPVAFYVASGAAGGRTAGVAWNILGITDLVLAVSLGFLSSPGPLQIIAHDQPNVLATSYPAVMTPAFAVPLSLILHGLSLWQLWRRGGRRERLTFAPAK
jgi:hypothetical protein